MFFCLFFCSCELGGECWPNIKDSTCAENKTQLVQSQENLSDCSKPTLRMSKERQPVFHDEKGLSQSKASASQRKQRSIHSGTEFSECSGRKSGEMPQGELVLVLEPKQMQASLIHSSSLILRGGPLVSDVTDNHTAQGEPSRWSEPDEVRLNPLPTQSHDFLPTFTNQRPAYVASMNTSSSNTVKQRYRKF